MGQDGVESGEGNRGKVGVNRGKDSIVNPSNLGILVWLVICFASICGLSLY